MICGKNILLIINIYEFSDGNLERPAVGLNSFSGFFVE